MSSSVLSKYLNPWGFRRNEARQRLDALRKRDGDNCRRCRRPMRFDFPDGHDLAPKVEEIDAPSASAAELQSLCLCHRRCNAESADNTGEVLERMQRRNEAQLLSKARKPARKRASA
jgi:hypothetical protein